MQIYEVQFTVSGIRDRAKQANHETLLRKHYPGTVTNLIIYRVLANCSFIQTFIILQKVTFYVTHPIKQDSDLLYIPCDIRGTQIISDLFLSCYLGYGHVYSGHNLPSSHSLVTFCWKLGNKMEQYYSKSTHSIFV